MKPTWLTLKYLPILPPNLRPIIKMPDNTILIHETNYLYSNIINCNNKIQKLNKTQLPKRFLNYENQLLQEKINSLLGNKKNKSKINSSRQYHSKLKIK